MKGRLLYLCAALLCAISLVTAAPAADLPAEQQVRQLLMATFDKPDARLLVEPIVVQGDVAIAGWTQAERGGRALLKRHHGAWQVNLCSGDGLKDPKVLAEIGMAPSDAKRMADRLVRAEASLPAAQRAKFSTFDGLLRMDAQGQHPH